MSSIKAKPPTEKLSTGLAVVSLPPSRAASAPSPARAKRRISPHGLLEGYFGAATTLGPGRAAGLALGSANAWMFGQSRADPGHPLAASQSRSTHQKSAILPGASSDY
jgi:hypothetical protein